MEKIFTLVPDPQTNKLTIELDGSATELTTCVVIDSWDKQNPGWFWKINKESVPSDPKIKTKNNIVNAELYVQGVLEYAGRDIIVGRHGTGIILGSGKPYVRAFDISVAKFMKENKISTLMKEPPATDRIRLKMATLQFRVFDLDGNEQMPVAGSFMLDPEKPWIVEHRRVQNSSKSVWKGIYIPNGWKFKTVAADVPAQAEASAESITHTEEAVMVPNSSEETFNTIGDAVGDVLNTVVTDVPKTEIPLEVGQSTVAEPMPAEEAKPATEAGLAVAAVATTPVVTDQATLG